MHRVGFEPTRIATSHLECDPLDRSGICAINIQSIITIICLILLLKK